MKCDLRLKKYKKRCANVCSCKKSRYLCIRNSELNARFDKVGRVGKRGKAEKGSLIDAGRKLKKTRFFFEKFCRKGKSDYLCSPNPKRTPVKAESGSRRGLKRNSGSVER